MLVANNAQQLIRTRRRLVVRRAVPDSLEVVTKDGGWTDVTMSDGRVDAAGDHLYGPPATTDTQQQRLQGLQGLLGACTRTTSTTRSTSTATEKGERNEGRRQGTADGSIGRTGTPGTL